MASIYKRKDIWWVAYYDGGKLVRESLKTTSKKTAEREKQAIEAMLLEPQRRVPQEKNLSVEDFWQLYLDRYARTHKRKRSVERTESFWKQLLESTKAKRLGDITKDDIERFKIWRTQLGNSYSTVNNALREIKALFNHATKLGAYSGRNPVDGVDFYPLPKTRPLFHTLEELEKLLAEAEKHSVTMKRVVLLCGWAGLRKNELANCRWEWFQFHGGVEPVIHVQRGEGFEIKDNEDRTIPMNQRIYDEFFPNHPPTGYVFESEKPSNGKSHYRFEPKKALATVLKNAGLPTEQPFLRLRHSFGSLLAQKGVSIFKISKWVGHSSVAVTEKHYASLQSYDTDINSF